MITWLVVKAWLSKAWAWLKKYWMWILFPIGLLSLGLRFLLGGKKMPSVLAPEQVGASQVAEEERQKAEEKVRIAEADRKHRIELIEKAHQDTIEKMTEEQRAEASALQEDPEKLTDYLLNVGKEMRRD